MELRLTDEQKLVRETTQRFIADIGSLEVVRQLAESGGGPGPEYQATAAELGWFSMLVPEDRGGGNVSGEGLRDLAVVAEERGRTLQGGAFTPTNLVAQTLAVCDPEESATAALEALLSGDAAAAWVMGVGSWSPGPGIAANRESDGYRLTGQVRMVLDAPTAQWLLITAQDGDSWSQFLVTADAAGIDIAPEMSLDITQRFGTVILRDVLVAPTSVVGRPGAAGEQVERQLQTGLVLTIADMVGAADALFALTVDYAKDRTAFGRPIGSFQALKHQLADLSLSLEAAKAIAVESTRAVQRQAPDAGAMTSIAKSWTSEMAIAMAQGCLQLFGGIGYTWEHDLHLYLRRLTVDSLLYGGARSHRRRLWTFQPANSRGEGQ